MIRGARDAIRILRLTPHPKEGGHFAETHRSILRLGKGELPRGRYRGKRSLTTAIYYLLMPGSFSPMHRLPGDEVFHSYDGNSVEMLLLGPGRGGKVVKLGRALRRGERPQVIVPGGAWQGARLAPGGRYALLGTTMAPGFDYRDYQEGDRASLLRRYPRFERWIRALTAGGPVSGQSAGRGPSGRVRP